MAYEGIEVEIKLAVDTLSVAKVLGRLREADATEIHHVDTYFHDPAASFAAETPIFQWLSIRDREEKFINFKNFHFGPDGIATHSQEVDLVVESSEEAKRLLEFLGYVPLITVDKTRTAAVLDGFEVALDHVVGLGDFVEIEALTPLETVEATRAALLQYAQVLGLSGSEADQKGYPHLLLELRETQA